VPWQTAPTAQTAPTVRGRLGDPDPWQQVVIHGDSPFVNTALDQMQPTGERVAMTRRGHAGGDRPAR
jgi:hypothetical protein